MDFVIRAKSLQALPEGTGLVVQVGGSRRFAPELHGVEENLQWQE